MLRRTLRLVAPSPLAAVRSSLVPLEVLTQLQLGITPALSVQRGFLLEHCGAQLQRRGITEAKLLAMDGRLCGQLTRRLVLEQYLAVPFRVFAFDMEFTGPPVFTAEGPTEDITEMGLYSPARDETFSCLVTPACGRKQGPGVEELTGITDAMLEKEGRPFVEAWGQFIDFVNTPEPGEIPGAEKRILLLSHGGKLADVSLIKWTLERFELDLPPAFVFGDTIHLIRDAHRRRPVTVDKHPPSWRLFDLVQWLHIPPTPPAHRAGNDAKMTWDALYHTMLRYGDDEVTPREQLVSRFFDAEAKALMRARQTRSGAGGSYNAFAGHGDNNDGNGEDGIGCGGGSYLAADVATGGSAAGGGGAGGMRAPTSGRDDALDLDFDDIFSGYSSSSSAATAGGGVEEFKLDDDDNIFGGPSGAGNDASHEEREGEDGDDDVAAPVPTKTATAKKSTKRKGAASTSKKLAAKKAKKARAGTKTSDEAADVFDC